ATEEVALGAPESILDLAIVGDANAGEAAAADWRRLTAEATGAGERVLALASHREREPWSVMALIGFADPPRPGIAEALATAREAGIQTIVVTGDHPQTAAAIARAAGLADERIVTGAELATWDEARLTAELPGLHVGPRSTP